MGWHQHGLPRVPGRFEGEIFIAEDFDAPLPEEILNEFEQGLTDVGKVGVFPVSQGAEGREQGSEDRDQGFEAP